MHVSLALILGGAAGNLYDRLFSAVRLPGLEPIRGHVRDFIDCRDLAYPYIFNVADALLVAGAAMILLHWLWSSCREGAANTGSE
jgi:signal peptidase II